MRAVAAGIDDGDADAQSGELARRGFVQTHHPLAPAEERLSRKIRAGEGRQRPEDHGIRLAVEQHRIPDPALPIIRERLDVERLRRAGRR